MATEYFSLDSVGGKYFECKLLRATLTTTACASKYRKAKEKGSASVCAHCATGAEHAGEKPRAEFSARECCRCGRTDLRLIGGYRCVNCFNRELEKIKGANAKGQPPVHAAPVYAMDVYVPGSRRRMHFDRVCSAAEAIVAAMRKTGATFARPVASLQIRAARVGTVVQMGLF